ncbi:hypothetical protein KY290_000690 [Solanum tuberosum]|uniref:Uncharacterized protein n=1 Tax=Solanum tuberosum TaxID=4113 RepID=A0ABQ7WK11_SOLTU|nr:hypothetical protein KY285_001272 [Solanum tuberosum]KAH0781092.1 hypothetical protein KY290_000690 [Solanum tuberosum]
MAHIQGQTSPSAEFRPNFYENFTWTSVKTLPMEPVVPRCKNDPFSKVKRAFEKNYDLIFAKILHGRPLRPYLWAQFALTANTIHFQGQTSN